MTTSPNSQNPEDLQTQNPNMTKDDDDQQPQPLSQSPQTLTLESPDLQNPQHSDSYQHQDQQEEENPQVQTQEREEPEGMSVSSPASNPPITDTHITITIPDLAPENPPLVTTPTVYRRATKRKKPMNRKQREALDKKIQILTQNLRPIPFVPNKTLDFSTHEKLLKRLGLWDFVHVGFDRNIRADLLTQLIATYSAQNRCSYVNEVRINVSRADLARALRLKKDKTNVVETAEDDLELASEESIAFVDEILSNWVLLHEDTWMMPKEVLNWTREIKDKHPEKVEWQSLLWFMVEKELVLGSQLVHCYYASHLQCLIKSQREEFFVEAPKVEVEVKEEEEEEVFIEEAKVEVNVKEDEEVFIEEAKVEVNVKEDEEDKDGVDVKMSECDDFCVRKLEEPNIELSLGQDNVEKEQVVEEDVMDFEECKEEEQGRWVLDGKNIAGEHFLQRCDLGEVQGLDCDGERKEEQEEHNEDEEEEEEQEEPGGFNLLQKCNSLERMASANLIQAMEVAQMPFSPSIQLRDHNSMEHLSSRAETNTIAGGSSIFGNVKREIDHEHDMLNSDHKRLRSDGPWDPKLSEFDMCMEQIQHCMGKARMMYEAKEQAVAESSMHQQILLNEVQQRENLIEHFHKTKYEEQQKRQVEIYRLERELYVMGNLLEGYRKALKETHRAFSEYRARSPLPDEPLYKDVGGTGGVVLSTMELEKQRLKQEEEDRVKRIQLEDKIKEFEGVWLDKFELHLSQVHLLDSKSLDVEKEVKLLKELFAKRKVLEIVECSPNEELLPKSSDVIETQAKDSSEL